jgi:hypothetical protein
MRVRGFTQDDAHIFCTEEQLAAECMKINDLILSVYEDFGFTEELVIKLSTRPEKRVGSDAVWDHAEDVMTRVLETIARSPATASRPRSIRARAPSTGRSSNMSLKRRHRPRLAVRHDAGRLQPAGALRRLLYRL